MTVLSLTKSVVISWKAQRHIFILKDKVQEGIQNLHSSEGCECGNHSCLNTLERILKVSWVHSMQLHLELFCVTRGSYSSYSYINSTYNYIILYNVKPL